MFEIFKPFSLSVLKLNVGFQGWNSQNACQNSKQGRSWSDCFKEAVWSQVCTVCMCLFGRQVVFKVLEYLLQVCLRLACWVILLVWFFLSADIFQNYFFLQKVFRNTIRVSNSLDADQVRHFFVADLVPNCLHRLSADDTSRQWVINYFIICLWVSSISKLDFTISSFIIWLKYRKKSC